MYLHLSTTNELSRKIRMKLIRDKVQWWCDWWQRVVYRLIKLSWKCVHRKVQIVVVSLCELQYMAVA